MEIEIICPRVPNFVQDSEKRTYSVGLLSDDDINKLVEEWRINLLNCRNRLKSNNL